MYSACENKVIKSLPVGAIMELYGERNYLSAIPYEVVCKLFTIYPDTTLLISKIE